MKKLYMVTIAAIVAALLIPAPGLGAQPTLDPACDLNGDGIGDLVFGDGNVPVGGFVDAGIINIRYGAEGGVASDPEQVWSQNTAGVNETAAAGDRFGSTFACGDFDGDGFDDLAIAVPGEDVGSQAIEGAGAVNVLYGSDNGLSAAGDQVFHQNTRGVKDPAEAGDGFGSAVVAGNFNGDEFEDLAIGVPNEDIGGVVDAGAVNVIYGSQNGLDPEVDDFWHQDKPRVKNAAQAGDNAGAGLAAGDFDGDGTSDLVIGVPNEDIGGIVDAGAINVIYGSQNGLDPEVDDFWHQNAPGIKESAAADEFFGLEMSVGDFENDGFDDLAIGVADESRGGREGDGVVNIIHGSASGLTGAGDELWHQNRASVKERAESGDNLGEDVDVADFDGDGFDDLAIGVPLEDVGGLEDAGAVNVIYGSANGLQAANDDLWHQNKPGVMSAANPQEFFGIGMFADDYSGDGRSDLLIASFAQQSGTFDANVLYSGPNGLSAAGDQYFTLR